MPATGVPATRRAEGRARSARGRRLAPSPVQRLRVLPKSLPAISASTCPLAERARPSARLTLASVQCVQFRSGQAAPTAIATA